MERLSNKYYLFFIFFTILLALIFLREPCWLVEGSLKAYDFSYYKQGKLKSFTDNLFLSILDKERLVFGQILVIL